jgi:diguanylate cyclase (GGDEF)-like protein/PAS domain S-box-containing protein
MARNGRRITVRAHKAGPAASEVGAALIDLSRDGVVAFDRAGRITVWSPAAAALTGLAAEDLVGRTLTRKVPWLAKADGRPLTATLRGTPTTAWVRLDRAGTDARVVEVRWQPLTDGDGAVRGGLAILCPADVAGARGPQAQGSTTQPSQPPPEPAAAAAGLPDSDAMAPGEQHDLLADALEALDHGFAIFDANGRLHMCNAKYGDLRGEGPIAPGVSYETIIRRSVESGAFCDIGDREAWVRRLLESHAAADGRVVEKRLAGDRWVATSRYRLRNGWVAAMRVDITELKRREAALRESEERFRALAEASFEAVVVHDYERVIDANRAFLELFGYAADEVPGIDLWRLVSPATQAEAVELLQAPREPAERIDQPLELVMRRKDGSTFPAELRGKSLPYGGRLARVVAMRDISARKRSEDHIRRLAHHDSLTELPNRSLFLDRLRLAMAQARRDGRPMAVLQLDLDNFKDINDTLGHPAGDTLLRACARRLQSIVHESDTVARIGGDEFAIILTGLERPIDAGHVAQRIIARLLEPVSCQGHEVHTSASIGITIFPDDDSDADQLLRNADIALYRAKANGRNTYSFFVEAMKRQVERRKELEAELRCAIAGHEFVLHFQPQVRLADRKVVGMEALMRWQHPTRGLVLPSEFLAVAEDAGLIVPIGLEVLSRACAQARAWLDAGLEFGRVAVNLAPAQFKARNLAYAVGDALQAAGLDARHIALEVTESAFLGRGTGRVAQTLARLHEMNVLIALDDFGSGYASLSHFKRFPIDRLKIDGSLVRDIGIDRDNTAIVRTVLSLGRSLGLEVVAEGVETEAQCAFLREHGCDGAQGYLFGRPIAAADAWHYLDVVAAEGLVLSDRGG